jgi:hypothetical protein
MIFHTANNLHINFYENIMGRNLVEIGLDQVGEFVRKLEGML